ncbi:type II CRISPR RNA-guided endonuclease Cas9 [Microvirga sp. 2MCAF38]|uniref:type II CRISPR RNA-guided endonuclease Cas9 n=1 Tax=Microvirga sp. 2MCAF38 TaxID=3232989 RepID=UPI003F99A483
MDWRLGIDLGATSLGWCGLRLDGNGQPSAIIGAGSRIYSDGRDLKSGASLAVDRRDARAARRRRDRFKQRQAALIKHLTKGGLFPADGAERRLLEGLDPFELRARALVEPLPLYHIGRAFFHLNQRRGFKSNRKAERKADDEAGKIAVGIDRLRVAIEESGARTFGEFLHNRRGDATDRNRIPSVRTRLRPETGDGAEGDGYDFYPGRALIEEEFDAIWEAQTPHHPATLTHEVHDRLFEIVFHQRPLKAPEVGICMLIPEEKRLPKAHPLFQQRRLLEELNALMIVRPGEKAERLRMDERELLFLKLKDKAKVKFETLRKVLKLDPEARFNKESENRLELKGDEVSALLGDKKRFGTRWAHLSVEAQWEVVKRLLDVETDKDDAEFRGWLEATHALSTDEARAVASTAARLPQGCGRFGSTATSRLIEALRHETEDGRVIVYSEAVARAGLGHHSDRRTGEVHATLPYYGVALEQHIMPGSGEPSDSEEMRVGRLTNPTVHIGLNQLRRVVNRLIRAYGPPKEIAIELARELKLTDDEKRQRNKENNDNRVAAEKRSKKLIEIGQPDTGGNRALLKLWEELNRENALDRRCIYTGEQISVDMLFSGAVEVDHILPFETTLDDSNANKIVCLREANRFKSKRSPYETWGHSPQWDEIGARAARLPKNKRWRFEPDAMERFRDEGGFLARHLVDTQYLSRLAREYLTALYPERGEGSSRVWVSPGRLTEMVRRKLGLNELLPDHNFAGGDASKNRLDHRHHAIDAAVVAIVDRSMLQAIARASGQDGSEGRERIIVPEPWQGFRDDLRRAVNDIVVSHRADHGTVSKSGLSKGRDITAGRLHNETAYGLTGETDAKGNSIVVTRKSLGGLSPSDLDNIRDVELKEALRDFTKGRQGKDFEKAIVDFPHLGPLQFRGIRRVRVVEPLKVIEIRDASGRAYKGYKGDSNYRYDVWELADGKWVPEVVSMFEAHQPGWISKIRADHHIARKVLSLQQNDVIAIEPEGGERRLMRVVKFSQMGAITLAAPNEAGSLKSRDAAPNDVDPFKYVSVTGSSLKKAKARQVRIDELGRVQDPGFPARTAKRRTRRKST